MSHTDLTSLHPLTNSILSALTTFHFKGDNTYLEDLVERIDAPVLREFTVTFVIELPIATPRLYGFIARMGLLKEVRQATVGLDPSSWSVGLAGRSGDRQFCLTSPFSAQAISPMAQLCNDLSPFLSQVEMLQICSFGRFRVSQDDKDPTPWLNFFQSFLSVKRVDVYKNLVPVFVLALREATEESIPNVLPALRHLFFEESNLSNFTSESIEVFLDARQLSGCPVALLTRK
jgi:hypothetical protein